MSSVRTSRASSTRWRQWATYPSSSGFVKTRFGEKFHNRFSNLLIQGMSIGIAFASHGFMDVAEGFRTVGTMIGYFQSRRRHFVGLLHILPTACRGQQVVVPIDTLNIFLPIIELSAVQMIGAQNALLVKLARSRLRPKNRPLPCRRRPAHRSTHANLKTEYPRPR